MRRGRTREGEDCSAPEDYPVVEVPLLSERRTFSIVGTILGTISDRTEREPAAPTDIELDSLRFVMGRSRNR